MLGITPKSQRLGKLICYAPNMYSLLVEIANEGVKDDLMLRIKDLLHKLEEKE